MVFFQFAALPELDHRALMMKLDKTLFYFLNYLVIGLLKIIERLMVSTRVMEFYLITSLLEEEKHL